MSERDLLPWGGTSTLTDAKALLHRAVQGRYAIAAVNTRSAHEAIAALDGPTLILTDIKGGSPCNVAMVMEKLHENVRVISGFNVPLLLHLFDIREDTEDMEELMKEAVTVGKGSVGIVEVE